ncbi:MAG: VanZ family protein, partial [Nitrososphaerales archaeon]
MISFIRKYRIQILLSILFCYCILLIIVSSIPGDFTITSNPFDKILHFGAYAILSIPLYFTLSIQSKIVLFNKYPGISTILLAFLFGFLNELHQLFIVSRTFNKFDLLANVLG